MPEKWNGIERRRNATDHDTLICLTQIMSDHVKNFDAHVVTDNSNFNDISKKLWTHAKFIYIGIGIVMVAQVFIELK